jgi:L-fuconolactonase
VLIDAHQHFWRVGENGFSWPTPDLAAIHRDFAPPDLAAVAGPHGLTGCVLVQSQPDDRDTEWLLALAAEEPLVLGVVGWVDLASPDAPARIARLSRSPKLRGLRPMLQSLEDDAWIAAPDLDPAFDAMVAHGLSLDALVLTRHLPHLLALARRRPDLAMVIDHGAKPPIAAGDNDGAWARGVDALAAFPQVFCKLSGLLTEAAPSQGPEALRPYVAHLVAAFGPRRLMWGSDWPVLNLAGDYGDWLSQARELSGLIDPGELADLFGETCRRFYRI